MRESQNRRLVEVCRRSRAVIAVSEALQVTLAEDYAIESIFIPNGVDAEECKRGNSQRFLDQFSVPSDFVLFVGSAAWVKRPRLLFEIARSLPSLSFVAIGPGLNATRMAHFVGEVPRNVVSLDRVAHETVLDAMHASKAVIITSKRETFSTVALEGLACGRPVVAPRGSGVDSIIGGVEGRLIFDEFDLGSAAGAILFAVQNPALGRRGQEYVQMKYDWRRLVPRLDAVYAEYSKVSGWLA